MREAGYLNVLRAAALAGILAGAGGSLALMLYVGRRNSSRLLLLMFAIWVVSPFAAAGWAERIAKRWPTVRRASWYLGIVVLAVSSLALYGDVVFGRPRPQPAFRFLVVPLASWILLAVVAALSWRGRAQVFSSGK